MTQPDEIRQNEKCDRNVCLYGYVRGSALKNKSNVHIPGVGDFQLNDVSFLSDPCPLPDKEKKRTLDDRERLIYAPFSGVGGLIYDKDAVYIDLGGSHSHTIDNTHTSNNPLINQVISSKNTIDSKLNAAKMKMFSDAPEFDNDLDDQEVQQGSSDEEEAEKEQEDEDEEEESEGDFESSDEKESEEDSENESEEDDQEKSELDEEDEDTFGSLKWKENLKEKAMIAFKANKANRTNWSKVIYGELNQSVPQDELNSDEDDDNLFKIKKINLNDYSEKVDNAKYNTSFYQWASENLDEQEQSDSPFESIRDCFVTGKWDKNSDAAHLLAGDDEVDENDFGDDDDEMFGDFEDMETGETFHQSESESDGQKDDNDDDNKNERKKNKNEMTKRERLIEKKKRLKEQFDREFDESKSADKTGESAYYDALKEEATEQTNLNRLEFEKLDDWQRIEFEGFRVGMYVRIEINSMPCEFVKNFDARYLSIIGCLESNESNIGYVQVRLKKHRWHNKILKTNDPLVISLGWRRFQTLPLYFVQDHNMRNRSLKYTPEHMHCHASFWGPITPQGTGFLAVQTMSSQNVIFFYLSIH